MFVSPPPLLPCQQATSCTQEGGGGEKKRGKEGIHWLRGLNKAGPDLLPFGHSMLFRSCGERGGRKPRGEKVEQEEGEIKVAFMVV